MGEDGREGVRREGSKGVKEEDGVTERCNNPSYCKVIPSERET